MLPVLADGVYKHALGAPKTWPPYTITLPNIDCAKCTIQIIQVMLDHPSNLGNLPDGAPNPDGFLYHHCMDVSVTGGDGGLPVEGDASADASTPADGGTSPGAASGCGCSLTPGPLAGGAAWLLALSLFGYRRIRRRPA